MAISIMVIVVVATVLGYYYYTTLNLSTSVTRTLRVGRIGVPEPTDMNWLAAKDIATSKYGIDVQFQYFSDASVGFASLLGGSVDISGDTINRVVGGIQRGADLKIFLVLIKSSDYVLVARQGINSLSDLAGKTIGVETIPGGTSYMIAQYIMRNAGVDPDIAKWTVVGTSSARAAALASGQIDAAAFQLWRYYALQKSGNFTIVGEHGKDVPQWITLVYSAKPEFIAQNRKLLVDFAKAQLLANREINQNVTLYSSMMDKYAVTLQATDSQQYWSFLVSNGLWPEDGGMKKEDFDWMMNNVFLPGGDITQALPFDQIADTSIVQDALSQLGS